MSKNSGISCAQPVRSLGIGQAVTRRQYTAKHKLFESMWMLAPASAQVVPFFTQALSTTNLRFLPLLSTELPPLSTGPINTITKYI